MSRLSIRARLTAAFAAGLIVILTAAAFFTYVKVLSDLNEALDESLASRSDDVASLVASAGPGPPDLGGERLVEGEDGFAQVLAPGGTVISSTLPPSAGTAISDAEATRASDGPILVGEREVPGIDEEAKILARPAGDGGGRAIVVVGATTEDRSEALAGLTGAFAIGAPIAILIASGFGYLLAGRALSPVEAMRRRASEITLDDSGERLPLPPADDEIRSLGRTLNEMLDRIEESVRHERAFVADASHELRTPLAILRAELELASKPGRSEDELRAALRSTAEEVQRLSRLAEDLLVLARSDGDGIPIKRESVDLTEMLDRVRGRFAERAAEEGRGISYAAPPGASAELDPLRIEQSIGDLVDNALRHGEGDVRLAASAENGRIRMTVSDDGAGIPRSFIPRAFDRFTRADEGRGGGSGLGLAIVRAVARAHGGDASATGATVTIDLPEA